jgi:dGTPase
VEVEGYTDCDGERWLSEQHSSRRSDFARDRARVLHSSALRRLAAKTQVLSPTLGIDFARNRLTHSLEVAQVGRELATRLNLDPDIVDTACLAHDLGHPPFGHNGEKALNQWAADIGGFEGNAQTLRILTRLEPKVFGGAGKPFGLNLTRASLDASCKYPWPREHAISDPNGRVKFGFFTDDIEAFCWMRRNAPDKQRCIEAEVMDLSDDIAYSVHDFEDAIFGEYIDPTFLSARAGHDSLIRAIHEWAGGDFTSDELIQAFDRLTASELWLTTWDGSRACQAKLKNFTSQMIGHFAGTSVQATREAYPEHALTRFSAHVVIPRDIGAEIAVFKGIVAAFIMSQQMRQPVYVQQRDILVALAQTLFDNGGIDLDPGFAADWGAALDDSSRKRVIVDQVASLTDQSALTFYERLVRH